MAHQVLIEHLSLTLGSLQAYPISSSKIITSRFEVYSPSTNGNTLHVGMSDVTTSWIPLAVGASKLYIASSEGDLVDGDYFDLSQIYVRPAAAGDVAIVQYYVAASTS